MLKDSIKVTGALFVINKDAQGNIKNEFNVPNLVVTTGKEIVAGRLGNDLTPAPSEMALGSDPTEPIAGHTGLLAELGRASITNVTVDGTSVTYTATFGPGVGTGPVVEAGVFNVDKMLCRTVFPVVNKSEFDSTTIIWTLTVN